MASTYSGYHIIVKLQPLKKRFFFLKTENKQTSEVYLSLCLMVDVDDIMSSIVVSAVHQDGQECVVCWSRLGLFQKLVQVHLFGEGIPEGSKLNLKKLMLCCWQCLPVIEFNVGVCERVVLEAHQVQMEYWR